MVSQSKCPVWLEKHLMVLLVVPETVRRTGVFESFQRTLRVADQELLTIVSNLHVCDSILRLELLSPYY